MQTFENKNLDCPMVHLFFLILRHNLLHLDMCVLCVLLRVLVRARWCRRHAYRDILTQTFLRI